MKREKGIRRLSDGRYRVYGRAHGRFYSRIFPSNTTLPKMRAWREQERQRIKLGLRDQEEAAAAAPVFGFRADAERYLEAVCALPTWKTRCKDIREWVEVFGDRPRAEISPAEIRAQRDRWLTLGPRMEQQRVNGKWAWVRVSKPLSASSVNHRLRALRNLWTVLDGRHAPNPVADVPEAEEPGDIPRAIPPAIITAILDAIPDRGRPPRRKDGRKRSRPTLSMTKARLGVMAWTGLPPAQLGQIDEKDVDLEGRRVYVRRRKKGRGVAASWRPLTAKGVEAFEALAAADAWGPFSPSAARHTFRRAAVKVQRELAEAGIVVDLSDVTPYDLRHSVATDTLRATGDLHATAALLGHSDLRTTERYAAAAVPSYLVRAAGKLARIQREKLHDKLHASHISGH